MEILFSTQKKSFDEGHVTDFKEIFQFTSVNAGEVLARKVPSVPGQPGISVTEDIIFPPDPKDVELLSGPGTIIDEEGNKVIAIAQGPLLRALLAKKFPEVSQNVMLLRNEVFKLPNKLKPQGLEECVTLLEYYLVKSPLTIKDNQQMNNMLKEVVVWKDVFESYEATKADVVSSYTLNSCIMATGDVRIAGTGSYNSKIHAGGKVKIHGVFRGGELYAGSDVYVRELGSNAGIPSRICTAESSVVTIGKAFENTTVTIGKVKHEFFRTEKRLKLALDKDEKSMIVISA